MYRCLSGIRTGGFTAVQDIHVKFKANQEKIAEEFIDFLNQEYVGIEFELDYNRGSHNRRGRFRSNKSLQRVQKSHQMQRVQMAQRPRMRRLYSRRRRPAGG